MAAKISTNHHSWLTANRKCKLLTTVYILELFMHKNDIFLRICFPFSKRPAPCQLNMENKMPEKKQASLPHLTCGIFNYTSQNNRQRTKYENEK